MENAAIYLLKSAALVAVFYFAYYIFLRRETFFSGNRWFLLAGLVTSFLLPLVTYTQIVWIDPVPVIQDAKISINITTTSTPVPIEQPVNWLLIALVVYSAGVAFFMIRFAADIFTLYKILKKYTPVSKNGFRIIDNPAITSPFSFFRYIGYNSGNLTTDELINILNHEKVHSRELHSFDMILVQLCTAIMWCNPFVWLYKKAVYQNLEFIADAKSTASLTDKTAYQKTLLKITVQPECMALTNHFYQSLIKKRIIMLNKNQSPRLHAFKYAFVLPVLCAFIYFFQVQTVAQTKPKQNNMPPGALANTESVTIEVSKDDTNPQLTAKVNVLNKQYDVDIRFSNIIRNAAGEITSINVEQYKEGKKSDFEMKIDQKGVPIKSFTIVAARNNGGETELTIGGSAEKTITATTPDGKPVKIKGQEFKYTDDAEPVNSGTVISEKDENMGGGNMHTITTTTSDTYKKNSMSLAELAKLVGVSFNTAYIVINGKEATTADLEKLDEKTISESVLSPAKGKYTDKYGEKAKNGVIIINTKNSGLESIISKSENSNALLTIHKTDSDKDINQIVKRLAEKGIKMTYSKLERNKQNQIISILITVEDTASKSSSAVWTAKENKDGIPDISVGRHDDKIIALPKQ